MFVSDWMTREVFTVAPDDPLSDGVSLMRERRIKHLPVVGKGRLQGMVSDRDIKEFSPSRATALDIFELHYLLARTRIKEVMRSKPVTAAPDTPVEEAAMIMFDNRIGCLPVLDNTSLVGIISDHDIFRALVDITGIRHGGNRLCITVEDRSGSIKQVADMVRKNGFRLQSILTSYANVEEGFRTLVLRTKGNGDYDALLHDLEGSYRNLQVKKG